MMATNTTDSATTATTGSAPQTPPQQADGAAAYLQQQQVYSSNLKTQSVDVNNNSSSNSSGQASAPPPPPPPPPLPPSANISAPPTTYSLGAAAYLQQQQQQQNAAAAAQSALLSNYNNQLNAAAAANNSNNLIANLNAANFANYLAAMTANGSSVPPNGAAAYASASNFLNGLQAAGQSPYAGQAPQATNVLLNGLASLNGAGHHHHHHQQQQQQQHHLAQNHYSSHHGHLTATSQPQQGHDDHNLYEYMHQLLEEKERLKELFNEPFNILLPISARLLDEEISRIRVNLFQLGSKESVCLPEPVGQVVQMTEKLYVPVKDNPDFNFVGRILGPRGMTAKQLEQETGCKIMVRGKGSMRDKAKEDQMKGKPNWEHLNDELHVLITVEDTKNRAEIKLKRAVDEIKKLLVPAPEGEDELKKKQLMELAIINGTYRDSSKLQQKMNQILLPGTSQLAAAAAAAAAAAHTQSPPNPLGQPLIISPRLGNSGAANANQMFQNTHHQLITQSTDPTTGGLIYTTIPAIYQDALNAQLSASQALLEYPNGIYFSQAGSIKPQRISSVGSSNRAHPYARVAM